MSSKMFSWIKKRCVRRFEKPDDNLKSKHYSKLQPATTNSNFYLSLNMNPLRQEEREQVVLYDEVYDEEQEETILTERSTQIPSPGLQVCPLCRSKISTDNSCKCVILRKRFRNPKIDRDSSPSSFQQITNSDDDSSGFYESVGSDSFTSGEMYSDNSVATDSDDGYEEVEFRPSLGHRRRYSVGSLHTVLQRSKLHSSIRVGYKDRKFRRTMDRRSLKEKVVRTKVYIL